MTKWGIRYFTRGTLALVLSAGAALTAHAAAITPQFDTFGELNDSTGDNVEFGGDGIPNDAVSITRIENNGNNITLGLTATPRGSAAPAVTNDGAGTFFAQPGSSEPSGDANRALWNFSFFSEVYGGNGTLADYSFSLFYDFDPAAGTDESEHGVFNAGAFVGDPASTSVAQGSQNLGFDYLAGSAFIDQAPSFMPFDPTVAGLYTFSLRAFDLNSALLGQSSIRVNVGNVAMNDVPEPSALALLGLGVFGIGFVAMSRRRDHSQGAAF